MFAHLEVGLLQDSRQFRRAVVFNLEAADVSQDLRHQLHVIVLHRLQLHLLQLLLSLGQTAEGPLTHGDDGGGVMLFLFLCFHVCGSCVRLSGQSGQTTPVVFLNLMHCTRPAVKITVGSRGCATRNNCD